jgi:hypothetical protein
MCQKGFLVAFFLVAGCCSSWARLGDTVAELHARYGGPFRADIFEGKNFQSFLFGDYTVTVWLDQGKSEMEMLETKKDERVSIEQCELLLKAVGGGGEWRKIKNFKVFETDWSRADGAIAFRVENLTGGGRLFVASSDHVLRTSAEQEKKRKDIAAAFGSPYGTNEVVLKVVVDPTNDPVFLQQQAIQKAAADAKAKAAEKALKFNQDSVDRGEAYGQYRMGMRYLTGDGVAKDQQKARDYLAKAADQGHVQAKEELSKLDK